MTNWSLVKKLDVLGPMKTCLLMKIDITLKHRKENVFNWEPSHI